MKFLLLPMICVGMFVSTAQAQWVIPNPYPYRHASTAAEGYLSGAARLMIGRGYAVDSYGRFLINRESARRQAIDNWSHSVRERWAIRDEYKARNKTENYLDRKERMLDQAERRHALQQREDELREKGILPPKTKGYFIHKGKKFYSIEEWKKSPEYAQQMDENRMRELQRNAEKLAEQKRQQDALDFLRMWRKMSYFDRERYSRLSAAEKARRLEEFKNPELLYKRLEEQENRRFYEQRPYLIPKAKQPYSQLPPVPPGLEDALNRQLYQDNPRLIPKAGTNGLPPLPPNFKYKR